MTGAGAGRRFRELVLAHCGTLCACCGTTEQLTIDHVDGNGTQHRRELGGRASDARDKAGTTFYRWLVRNGFPEGFQTLCAPCNSSKGSGPECKRHRRAG